MTKLPPPHTTKPLSEARRLAHSPSGRVLVHAGTNREADRKILLNVFGVFVARPGLPWLGPCRDRPLFFFSARNIRVSSDAVQNPFVIRPTFTTEDSRIAPLWTADGGPKPVFPAGYRRSGRDACFFFRHSSMGLSPWLRISLGPVFGRTPASLLLSPARLSLHHPRTYRGYVGAPVRRTE